jgi:hypothetical protein
MYVTYVLTTCSPDKDYIEAYESYFFYYNPSICTIGPVVDYKYILWIT